MDKSKNLDGQNTEDAFTLSTQEEWYRNGQIGCIFAQVANENFEQQQWPKFVIHEESDYSYVPHIMKGLSKPDSKPEMVSFLFPKVLTETELVEFTKYFLGPTSPFYSEDIVEYEDMVGIRLRFTVNENLTSWIIGMGPFSFFPKTRQSPCLEFVMRVKPKVEEPFYKLNPDKTTAHVADIDLDLSHKVMEILWVNTVQKVNLILGEAEKRKANILAKAGITYSLPLNLWEEIRWMV